MSDNELLINNQTITDYINEAMKSKDFSTQGINICHTIVDSDSKKSISFIGETGLSYIINELSVYYPDAKMDMTEHINGFSTDRLCVSLDNENHLFINLFPLEDVTLITRLYQNFRDNIDEIITPLGYECVAQ